MATAGDDRSMLEKGFSKLLDKCGKLHGMRFSLPDPFGQGDLKFVVHMELIGDGKFVTAVTGHGGPNSTYNCPICECTKIESIEK